MCADAPVPGEVPLAVDSGLTECGLVRPRCTEFLRACLLHRSHLSWTSASLSMSRAQLHVEQRASSSSSLLAMPHASSTAWSNSRLLSGCHFSHVNEELKSCCAASVPPQR